VTVQPLQDRPAEDADASIGLVGIHPRGRTQLRLGGDTTGVVGASVVHGTTITHSILSLGVQPFQARPAFLAGLGLGVRASFTDDVHLDFDAITHLVFDDLVGTSGPGLLVEARVAFGARLIDVLGLYGGVPYQLHVGNAQEGGLGSPIGESVFGPTARGWPLLFAGIELF
jgi:hypothetical protein